MPLVIMIANKKAVLASAAAYAASTPQGITFSISAAGFISDGLLDAGSGCDRMIGRLQLVEQGPMRNSVDCELVDLRGSCGLLIKSEERFQR